MNAHLVRARRRVGREAVTPDAYTSWCPAGQVICDHDGDMEHGFP